jgi:hypothetical protein
MRHPGRVPGGRGPGADGATSRVSVRLTTSRWRFWTSLSRRLLHLRPSLKAAIEQAAEAENRSITSLLEKLMMDYLRDRDTLTRRSDKGSRK